MEGVAMPRQGRLNCENGIYHVITRGIERRPIFCDDSDRREFLQRFATGLTKSKCRCLGWALMPNHFHLIIKTGPQPLSSLMRGLLTGYAVYFNHRYKRCGYLYQNRYKSILCQEEIYLLELVRYVHLNPLRAKLVKDMSELSRYEWSGHAALLGNTRCPWQSMDEVLQRFGADKQSQLINYENFVAEGEEAGRRDDLTGGGLLRSAGGWKGVLALRRSNEQWRSDERVLGEGSFVEDVLEKAGTPSDEFRIRSKGWDIVRLGQWLREQYAVETSRIRKKVRTASLSQAKAIFAYAAAIELGISRKEVGEYLNCTRAGLTQLIDRGRKIFHEHNIKLLS
jgi:REP element-mobilizing transposase RayT